MLHGKFCAFAQEKESECFHANQNFSIFLVSKELEEAAQSEQIFIKRFRDFCFGPCAIPQFHLLPMATSDGSASGCHAYRFEHAGRVLNAKACSSSSRRRLLSVSFSLRSLPSSYLWLLLIHVMQHKN
eukprot:GHVO01036194.1.p2 GENE.GHVO01036194.1~~GHVO01036194.1.p2  ORF type:complete len:128 (+),score=13.30 GHVO01036194.1:312-695(+)